MEEVQNRRAKFGKHIWAARRQKQKIVPSEYIGIISVWPDPSFKG